jgi:hypothetical protein
MMGERMPVAEDSLGPEHTVTIEGVEVTYRRHICGLRAGSLHTYLGDFDDFQELGRYVRGRKGIAEPIHWQDKLEFWPGVYNPSNPSRGSAEDSGDGSGHGADVCNCQDPHGPTCGKESV